MRLGWRRWVWCVVALLSVAACTADATQRSASSALPSIPLTAVPASPLATGGPTTPTATASPMPTTSTPSRRSTLPAPRRAPSPSRAPTSDPPRPSPSGLPLAYPTGTATRIVTVVAPSTRATSGRLQLWQKTASGWVAHGAAVTAYLGSAGLIAHPSESLPATPMGSFTLTQAFGHDPDPGTGLPYTRTTPADWWISEPGPLYNTMQRCSASCGFRLGAPNERLYYTTPYYDYAIVMDYNRGPIIQGAGSAFFLHVAVATHTDGCISMPRATLLDLLRWLTPAAHPRVLVGVGA